MQGRRSQIAKPIWRFRLPWDLWAFTPAGAGHAPHLQSLPDRHRDQRRCRLQIASGSARWFPPDFDKQDRIVAPRRRWSSNVSRRHGSNADDDDRSAQAGATSRNQSNPGNAVPIATWCVRTAGSPRKVNGSVRLAGPERCVTAEQNVTRTCAEGCMGPMRPRVISTGDASVWHPAPTAGAMRPQAFPRCGISCRKGRSFE